MSLISRAVKESPLLQGVDEIIAYQITTTPWASNPVVSSVVVKDISTGAADVSATVMPSGSHSVTGDVITLKPLQLLTVGKEYRVEVKFVADGQTWETHLIVQAEL